MKSFVFLFLVVCQYFVRSVHPCHDPGDVPFYSPGLEKYVCYRDIGEPSEPETPLEGDVQCTYWKPEFNSHLVSFHSDEEVFFVDNFLRTGSYMWSGVRKVNPPYCPQAPGVENDYNFTDGSSTAWLGAKGKFDCDGEGACFYFRIDFQGYFHDRDCEPEKQYQRVCSYIVPNCHNVSGYQSGVVCSGRGECFQEDKCSCTPPYYGSNCELYECDGVASNGTEGDVCSGNGECVDHDTCFCDPGYSGDSCDQRINEDARLECSDVGDVLYNETCTDDGHKGCCYRNFGSDDRSCTQSEDYCQTNWDLSAHLISFQTVGEVEFVTSSILSVDGGTFWSGLQKKENESPCPPASGYRNFDGSNTSFAETNLEVSCDDSSTKCLGILPDGHFFDETCSNYTLQTLCKYEVPNCNGILASDFQKVCSGKGKCVAGEDGWECDCLEGYSGDSCELYYCFGKRSDDESVCTHESSGSCVATDICVCEENVFGVECNDTTCHDIPSTDTENVCGGRGKCLGYDNCVCDYPYFGDVCEFGHACSENGSIYYEGYCYESFTESFTKPQCLEFCLEYWVVGSNMISILDEDEEQFVVDNFVRDGDRPIYPNDPNGLWIGLEKIESSNVFFPCSDDRVKYRWTDGSSTEYVEAGPVYVASGLVCSNNDTSIQVEKTEWNDLDWWQPRDCGCKYFVPECYGIRANVYDEAESVCGNHGWCVASNNCSCVEGYSGSQCTNFTCNGIQSWDEVNVCSGGRGACTGLDQCQCFEPNDYFGSDCEISICYGVFSNDTKNICSGRGECSPSHTCRCDPTLPYNFGVNCNETICLDGYWSNDTENVCQGHGKCHEYIGPCVCDENYFGSSDGQTQCNITQCDGVFSNDTENVCGGHGVCQTRICDCQNTTDAYYMGDYCNEWYCDGISNLETKEVCSGFGVCDDVDSCVCVNDDYSGPFCQYWSCWDYESTDMSNVCAGHGFCIRKDFCACITGYSSQTTGGECTEWKCGDFDKDDSEVCNSRGTCVGFNKCDCKEGFEGDLCDTWSCGFDKDYEDLTCGGHGECKHPNECDCYSPYGGELCATNQAIPAVLTPLFSLLGLFILCTICCVFCFGCLVASAMAVLVCILCVLGVGQASKLRRYTQLKNFEVLLKEQEVEDDMTVAHLRINTSLFEVKFSAIHIDKMLGEGGSTSVVYRATWEGKVVAFKCFKTRVVCQSQEKFDEFEREVEVLASVSHPNIIRFFGATIEAPRIGIIMEFCENGDIVDFLKNYSTRKASSTSEESSSPNDCFYPLHSKIRFCLEVILGMDYLHARNIIHRDLKLENVLVDKDEKCRIMDFGLSTIVETMSVAKTTRIGTNLYMAPETLSESKYTEKCDVFSFAIFIYIIFTEIWEPYGEETEDIHIEVSVASNPDFRPPLVHWDRMIPPELNWVKTVMILCWGENPKSRPDFRYLNEMFKEKLNVINKNGTTFEYLCGRQKVDHFNVNKGKEMEPGPPLMLFSEEQKVEEEEELKITEGEGVNFGEKSKELMVELISLREEVKGLLESKKVEDNQI